MRIITRAEDMPLCALALGNFDGVHPAHVGIINACIENAKVNNLKSGVLIFENHTETVCKNKDIKLLTTLDEKLDIIDRLGVDFVFIKKFDEHIMKMNPENFFNFLINELNAKALFAGFDYSFGYMASGKADLLSELGEKNGIDVYICDEVDIDNEPISSTKIRELIKCGEVKKSKKYLNRFYEVSGKVVKGKQNGRKMGLPTANIDYHKEKLLPCDGVYSGYTVVDNKEYKSLINIGKNPTFDAVERTVESYITDFDGDIYGKNVTVGFYEKIRGEKKFGSMEELKKQIESDLEQVFKGSADG